MNVPYQETLLGEAHLRLPPGDRHEQICRRLHALMTASVDAFRSTRLLEPRTKIVVAENTIISPDLSLLASATGKLWMAVEIIHGADHHVDTVIKKQIYEDLRIPRLWMLDSRYDSVEVYHASPYGLRMKQSLAGREHLEEPLIPEFQVCVNDLFAD